MGLSLIERIASTAEDVVEAAGIEWQIRKITSELLAQAGHASLAMLPVEHLAKLGTDDVEDMTPAGYAKLLKAMSTKDLKRAKEAQSATVAAGTVAVREPDGEWEPLKLVIGEAKTDPSKGVIRVADLPADVEDKLFAAIMSLTTDGGAAVERLNSFSAGPVAAVGD